jgi:nitroreductase
MLNLLRTRRSIRIFQDKPIDNQLIDIIKESLLRSPSSRGINPWEFIFVTDRSVISKLSDSKEHGSQFLKGAPFAIVVCGDETKSDVWIEDCSIASIIAQLTAHSLGLGSCWIQIRNRKHNKEISSESYIQNLLEISSSIRIASIIAIGWPDEQKKPVPFEKLDFSKIKMNKY